MRYSLQDQTESWEPLQVRDLVQRARLDGHTPTRLSLGHCEVQQLRQHYRENYPQEVPDSLTDTYYLGLKVEEMDEEHFLALDGEKWEPADGHGAPCFQSRLDRLYPEDPEFEVPSELRLYHEWDASAMRELIEHKSTTGRTPAFLFLGHHETFLLRTHLAEAFGSESVRNLKNLYYMGLEVIEIHTDYFLRTAGSKRVKSFRDKEGRHPKWKDIESGSLWSLSLFE